MDGLQALEWLYENGEWDFGDAEPKEIEEKMNIVENELVILKEIKNLIEFHVTYPTFEFNKEENIGKIIENVSLRVLQDMDYKKKTLFRNWILSECCPEEIKAFKIAISKEVDFLLLKRCKTVNEYNKYYSDGSGINLSNNEFMILKGAIENV